MSLEQSDAAELRKSYWLRLHLILMLHVVAYGYITFYSGGLRYHWKTVAVWGALHAQFSLLILLSRVAVRRPGPVFALLRFSLPFLGFILCWYALRTWMIVGGESEVLTLWTFEMLVHLFSLLALSQWLGSPFGFYPLLGIRGRGFSLGLLMQWVTVCAMAFAFWSMGLRYGWLTGLNQTLDNQLLSAFVGLMLTSLAVGCWSVRQAISWKKQITLLTVTVGCCAGVTWGFNQVLVALGLWFITVPFSVFAVHAAVVMATLWMLPQELFATRAFSQGDDLSLRHDG